MNITLDTYTERRVGEMVRIYLSHQSEPRWEKVMLKENTELYMNVQTGELSLVNPTRDTEWETYKSSTTGKTSYY